MRIILDILAANLDTKSLEEILIQLFGMISDDLAVPIMIAPANESKINFSMPRVKLVNHLLFINCQYHYLFILNLIYLYI